MLSNRAFRRRMKRWRKLKMRAAARAARVRSLAGSYTGGVSQYGDGWNCSPARPLGGV
ncbi:MAG: hypothetical protein ACPLSY_03450 [Moorellaceae bacterium]